MLDKAVILWCEGVNDWGGLGRMWRGEIGECDE